MEPASQAEFSYSLDELDSIPLGELDSIEIVAKDEFDRIFYTRPNRIDGLTNEMRSFLLIRKARDQLITRIENTRGWALLNSQEMIFACNLTRVRYIQKKPEEIGLKIHLSFATQFVTLPCSTMEYQSLVDKYKLALASLDTGLEARTRAVFEMQDDNLCVDVGVPFCSAIVVPFRVKCITIYQNSFTRKQFQICYSSTEEFAQTFFSKLSGAWESRFTANTEQVTYINHDFPNLDLWKQLGIC